MRPRRNPALWHSAPGIVAVYQPLYGPDELSVRQNMAQAGAVGRYAAAPGTAPAWARDAGWGFNGTDQWLDTGISPNFNAGRGRYDRTFIVRIKDAVWVNISHTIMGVTYDAANQLGIGKYYVGAYFNGQPYNPGGALATSGVFAVDHDGKGYVDGVYVGGVGAGSSIYSYTTNTITIGAANGTITQEYYYQGDILAALIAERTLTAAEMWLYSQQMAHLDYADFSVWTPARRWFIPPPPPVAATPVLSTIYINSADVGDTSLLDDVSGAAVDSTYARTGTNSFKLQSGDYLQADLTSSATKYTKFGLLVTDTPASDALLVAWQETGTAHVSLYLTDKLTLQMRQGSTIIQTSPTTLETETWYCVETKIVVHDTIGRFQVRIDGVDDMAAIGINTDDDVSGTINEIRFEGPVDDTYIDDIVVREDQWCGTGGVYVVVPTAAGTVEEWTGAYSDVDDLPPSFTDYAEVTAESGSDQLFRHGGLGGDYDVSVVGVFAKGRLDSEAAEVPVYALVRSSLIDNVGYAQTLDTTGVYARQLLTTDPNGTVAWTAYAVDNALQIGVRG